ncbi:SCO family protein [Virgibacillus alimentarius]|uniref:Protein SCO1/2 n=1 Tax=Virgibacillus alimentarius TaxID=698769 RepID=A0ABS4S4C9_9BACI|nr:MULTISPECIES: SCO family protein [Virgibacillus]MBP2256341.1 protein SCO1/2 [Virgibacillus alimentarius]HLR66286.1 SCO family protein [Virgibacillus sp.]
MKKLYIIFGALLILGISSGIFYLKVIKPGSAELPEDVVMETAFNEEYSFADMPKKARLIEFMYTNCPDVCPTTTLEMSKLRHKLMEEGVFGDKVEFITITINPEHDTNEVLRDYASRFEVTTPEDGWVFLRSSEEDTKKVADAFDFLYRDPGTGDIIHSTFTYFLDENNNLVEKFTMGDGFNKDKVYKRIMNTIS